MDGKLNLETLEIEKQPKFKDGDILSCDEDSFTRHTTLILHKDENITESIVSLIRHKKLVETNVPIDNFLLSRLYPAREDEKKELFDALAKGGKVWDAEKKIIVKKSILEIVEKNNLEILKIDLVNSDEAFARRYNEDRNIFSCKVYITLEDLDFEVDSVFWHDDVLGTVYCQDKDTKEPVWIVSWGDEDGSWWEVNRVPDFYKNQFKKLEDDTKADMEG